MSSGKTSRKAKSEYLAWEADEGLEWKLGSGDCSPRVGMCFRGM